MRVFFYSTLLSIFIWQPCSSSINRDCHTITPNDFAGTDIERIQAAIDSASKSTHLVVIPRENKKGTHIWMIDRAILLPSNTTVILRNCTLQLSDSSRDNMFRSNNVGIGITNPKRNHNINIVGEGSALLLGASNPRATGDAGQKLSLQPNKEKSWNYSYGSDAGRVGIKQTGDWRNIMILMAYVDGFKLKNVIIKNSHAWAMSFERTRNATLSDITFENPSEQIINGREVKILNRDGIDMRQGCKHFRINNTIGNTGDDFIALSNNLGDPEHRAGSLNSTMVTEGGWHGPQDDIEDISIDNISCQTETRAVAIRSSGEATISKIYINNVRAETRHNTILVGNKHYGHPPLPGKINNIYAMNLTGDGESLILIVSPIADCVFMNGVYTGDGAIPISYNLENGRVKNVKVINMIQPH